MVHVLRVDCDFGGGTERNLITRNIVFDIDHRQRATARCACADVQQYSVWLDLACGDRLDLVMGRQDIADHLGLTIETVSRVLASLRKLGAILIPNSHQIVLRDIAALRALCAPS